jgi:hypothetical protein
MAAGPNERRGDLRRGAFSFLETSAPVAPSPDALADAIYPWGNRTKPGRPVHEQIVSNPDSFTSHAIPVALHPHVKLVNDFFPPGIAFFGHSFADRSDLGFWEKST